ncbi:hypothetical protein GCM10009592_19330 [Brachybacterium rhamnosum]
MLPEFAVGVSPPPPGGAGHVVAGPRPCTEMLPDGCSRGAGDAAVAPRTADPLTPTGGQRVRKEDSPDAPIGIRGVRPADNDGVLMERLRVCRVHIRKCVVRLSLGRRSDIPVRRIRKFRVLLSGAIRRVARG